VSTENDLISSVIQKFHAFTDYAIGEFVREGYRGTVYVWIDFADGRFRADRDFPEGQHNVTGIVIDDAGAEQWMCLKGGLISVR
jgi:hypothetical protein